MIGKGSLGHNRRSFFAENVKAEKTADNITYKDEPLKKVYAELFETALQQYNEKQKRADRRIENYYDHIRTSKQEKLFHEVIFQVGNAKDCAVASKEGEIAQTILNSFMQDFEKRNPHLRVFSAHLHMDEATPHLHIDFIPFTTGSKRGLETRVSLKKALEHQGFKGGSRSETEMSQWIESEKERLAEVMKEHGVQWKQLGTKLEHLSVLNFKKQERQKEVEQLDKTVQKLRHQQIKIQELEQIPVSKVPLSSKVMLEKADYEKLSLGAQKYVAQVKKESKLEKLLAQANATIRTLQKQVDELSEKLKSYTSIQGQLDRFSLEEENQRLSKENSKLKSFLESNGLGNLFEKSASKQQSQKNHQER